MNTGQVNSTGGSSQPPPNPNYKATPPADVKQYGMTTDTGEVVLRWPSVLTSEDLKQVEHWLTNSLMPKIKRSLKDASAQPEAKD